MSSQEPPVNKGPAEDEGLVIRRTLPGNTNGKKKKEKKKKKAKKAKKSRNAEPMKQLQQRHRGNPGEVRPEAASVKGLRSFQFLLVNVCLELSASWFQAKHLEMIEELSVQDAYAEVGDGAVEEQDANDLGHRQGRGDLHQGVLESPRDMSAHLSMANVTLRYIQYALELMKQNKMDHAFRALKRAEQRLNEADRASVVQLKRLQTAEASIRSEMWCLLLDTFARWFTRKDKIRVAVDYMQRIFARPDFGLACPFTACVCKTHYAYLLGRSLRTGIAMEEIKAARALAEDDGIVGGGTLEEGDKALVAGHLGNLRVALAFNSALCALYLKPPQPKVALEDLAKCKKMLKVGSGGGSLHTSSTEAGLEAVISGLTDLALRKQAAMAKAPSMIEPTRPTRGGKRRHGAGPRQKRVTEGVTSKTAEKSNSLSKQMPKPNSVRAKGAGAPAPAAPPARAKINSDDEFDPDALIAAIDRELQSEKVSAMIPYIGRSSYAQHGVRTADVFEKERQKRKRGKVSKLANLLY